MDKVKIGFLGCGYMGQLAHLTNYAEIPDCEIVAIADSKTKQTNMVAQRYGIPNVYSDYNQILENKEITAVIAAQPFDNHVNIVPDVLNAGKHLLTEKPLCIFAHNGKKLADLAAQNRKIHMVGYHKRSDAATVYAMDIIKKWKESREMGDMKYIRITMPPGDWVGGRADPITTNEAYPAILSEKPPEGMSKNKFDRYVGFVNYYIHQVNLLRYLLGEDYKITFADRSGVMLAVESKSGICGVIEMAPYNTSDDWQEEAMICFDRGWIKVTFPAPLSSQLAGKITIFTDNGGLGVSTSPRMPNIHAMKSQAINFIKAVKGEIEPPCQSSEAVKDLEIAMDYINKIE